MALSNDLAALIGFACESVLYGANAILFLVSLTILSTKRHQTKFTHPTILLNCLIFLCCTTHLAIEFNHYYTTLARRGVNGYANETMPLLGADILLSVTDFLGDMALIYRCWMLWKRPIVVILPLLTAIAGLACIGGVAHLVLTTDPTAPAPPAIVVPLALAGYSLPLCTNVIVTGLIVYHIWHYSYNLPSSPVFVGHSAARRAMTLVIESGLLYLLTQLVYVTLFALQHPAMGIIAVMAVQIYGIAPTLINIRVALGLSSENYSNTAVMTTSIQWGAPKQGSIPSDTTDLKDEADGERHSYSPHSEQRRSMVV